MLGTIDEFFADRMHYMIVEELFGKGHLMYAVQMRWIGLC